MSRLKSLVLAVGFVAFIAAPVMTTITPQPVSAAVNCDPRFLGIPAWYRGMAEAQTINGNETCVIKSPEELGGIGPFIWRLVLNIIEMALVATAYIAAFFILFGGFQFLTGGASPGTVEKARKTILNAIIGLAISMGAIVLTNVIFAIFG